jgi:4-amino-4-deoxy-L-arabinose transferase-like glycosyltransferase
LLLAALLRFTTLGLQSLWTDEQVTAILMAEHLGAMLRDTTRLEQTPPLFFIVEWASAHVFGQGDVGLRVLPALCGTATVGVTYAIGAAAVSQRAGLIAAALAAVNPMLWWYSQEARAYALLIFLSAVALLCLVRALQSHHPGWVMGWGVACALALATHYVAFYIIAPEAVWFLVVMTGERIIVLLAWAEIAAAAVGLSVVAAFQKATAAKYGKIPFAPRLRQILPHLLAGVSPASPALWLIAGPLVGLALGLAVARAREQRAMVVGLLATGIVGVALPVGLALVGADYVLTRNLTPAIIPLLVVAGAGIASLRPRLAWTLGAAIGVVWLVAIGAVIADPMLRRIDLRGALRALGKPDTPRLILLPGSYFSLNAQRYLPGALPYSLAASLKVGEIDVVTARSQPGLKPCLAGQTCQMLPFAAPAGPPAPGFQLAGRRSVQVFTATRWRAARPVVIELQRVAANGPAVPGTPPDLFYQP